MTRAEKIAAYEALAGPGFGDVRRFCVESSETEEGERTTRLHLCLARDADPAAEQLALVFGGVRQLHCGDLITSYCGPLAEIMDVSERQLEGIAFYVWEGEDSMFSFYCSGFRIATVGRPGG